MKKEETSVQSLE